MDRVLAQYYVKQFAVKNELECILVGLQAGLPILVNPNLVILVTRHHLSEHLFRITLFKRNSYPKDIVFEPHELGIRVGIQNVSTQTEIEDS